MLVDVVCRGVLASPFFSGNDDRERIYAVVLYHAAKVACVGPVIMVELFAQRVVSVEHGHAAFAQRGHRRLLRHRRDGVIFLIRGEALGAQTHGHAVDVLFRQAFAIRERRLCGGGYKIRQLRARVVERRKSAFPFSSRMTLFPTARSAWT